MDLTLHNSDDDKQSPVIDVGTRPLDEVLREQNESISMSDLPSTVVKLSTHDGNCDVYLLGSAHFSRRSIDEVIETINKVRPSIVVVELCNERRFILDMNEEDIIARSQDNLTMNSLTDIIKKDGIVKGITLLLFLRLSASLTKTLGSAPGGEFRAAAQAAKQIPNCLLFLGDRSLRVTISRTVHALSWWQRIKFFCQVVFSKFDITADDVENLKEKDLLQQMLHELGGDYPAFKKVILDERNVYLAHTICNIAHSTFPGMPTTVGPRRVVAIVGIGHRDGIVENWGKTTDEQFYELQRIPEPSVTRRIVGKTIKYTIYGCLAYAGYRLLFPATFQKIVTHRIQYALQ